MNPLYALLLLYGHPIGEDDGGGEEEVPVFDPRRNHILQYFPQFMQESDFYQWVSKVLADEAASRVGDLYYMLGVNQFVSEVTKLTTKEWTDFLDIPYSPNEDLSYTKSKIIAKTAHRTTITIPQMENIVRGYMEGTLAYTRASVVNSVIVPLSTLEDIIVGNVLYIGSSSGVVQSLNPATLEVTLETPVTAPAYSPVMDTRVSVFASPEIYRFTVFVDSEKILDLDAMVDAIKRAKPAHLEFVIADLPVFVYDQPGLSYDGDDFFDTYDDPLAKYDDPGRTYDLLSDENPTYDGTFILYDGTGGS